MRESRKTLLVLLILLFFAFLPTLSEVPFPSQDTPLVMKEVLTQTAGTYSWLTPAIHVATLTLLVALYFYGSKIGRVASAFFGILFVFIAFGNHVTDTQNYGLVVVTGNLASVLVVGLFWMWEAYKPRNEYVFRRLSLWRYWLLPLVFLAFWFPMNVQAAPDFNPLLLLTSSFGVMFCPTAPLIIALLTLIYPNVNKRVLRVTSFVGLVFGFFNVLSFFVMPGYPLWLLILHAPLIFISFYGLLLPTLVRHPSSQIV
ncbi:MAG: hypothetical protein ACFFCB_07370 [Candidatus Odinarchaeota archaeon]